MTYYYTRDVTRNAAASSYSVCVRAERDFCCVEYEVCPDQDSPGPNSPSPLGFSFDSGPTMSKADDACLSVDHISIPQSGEGVYQ